MNTELSIDIHLQLLGLNKMWTGLLTLFVSVYTAKSESLNANPGGAGQIKSIKVQLSDNLPSSECDIILDNIKVNKYPVIFITKKGL